MPKLLSITMRHFYRNINHWKIMRRSVLLLCRCCYKYDVTSLPWMLVNVSVYSNISDISYNCTKHKFKYFKYWYICQLTWTGEYMESVVHSSLPTKIGRYSSSLKHTWKDCWKVRIMEFGVPQHILICIVEWKQQFLILLESNLKKSCFILMSYKKVVASSID